MFHTPLSCGLQVSLPELDLALPAYYVLAVSEASSNLARYDGVRYGLRHPVSIVDTLTCIAVQPLIDLTCCCCLDHLLRIVQGFIGQGFAQLSCTATSKVGAGCQSAIHVQ